MSCPPPALGPRKLLQWPPVYLVRVKGKIGIQEAPDIVGLSTFVHLVGGVPDFHIHGPIGHALVLEALGPGERQQSGDSGAGGGGGKTTEFSRLPVAHPRTRRLYQNTTPATSSSSSSNSRGIRMEAISGDGRQSLRHRKWGRGGGPTKLSLVVVLRPLPRPPPHCHLRPGCC